MYVKGYIREFYQLRKLLDHYGKNCFAPLVAFMVATPCYQAPLLIGMADVVHMIEALDYTQNVNLQYHDLILLKMLICHIMTSHVTRTSYFMNISSVKLMTILYTQTLSSM